MLSGDGMVTPTDPPLDQGPEALDGLGVGIAVNMTWAAW